MSDRVAIYAYVDDAGKYAYVGQTVRPDRRDYAHRNGLDSKIKEEIKRMKFLVLNWVSLESANQSEKEEIEARWKIGECWLNRKSPPRSAIKQRYHGWSIFWVEKGITFDSATQAGRALGVSSHQVKSHILNPYPWWEGITLISEEYETYRRENPESGITSSGS